MQREPLPYHVAVAEKLEQTEPELWRWFRSDQTASADRARAEGELHRETDRIARQEDGSRLYGAAEAARDGLSSSAPIMLHRLREARGLPRASLVFTEGQIAIACDTAGLEPLDTETTLPALFAREIARYELFTLERGRYRSADRLLSWLTQREACPSEYVETWRRNRLATEIYCDLRAASAHGTSQVARALDLVIGDTSVRDGEEAVRERLASYERGEVPATSLSERDMRRLAMMWSETLPPAALQDRLHGLVSGRIDLGALDLLDQQRLHELTRSVVDRVATEGASPADAILAYAREMFPGYEPPLEAPRLIPLSPEPAANVIDYLTYLLLDLASIPGTGLKSAISVSAMIADELGIGHRFREVARQELRGRRGLQAGLASRTA